MNRCSNEIIQTDAIAPFQRMPPVLEEVVCECVRPSHLSPYTDIHCQPVKYRLPVLIQDETGHYQPAHEELTLACIPVVPVSSLPPDIIYFMILEI